MVSACLHIVATFQRFPTQVRVVDVHSVMNDAGARLDAATVPVQTVTNETAENAETFVAVGKNAVMGTAWMPPLNRTVVATAAAARRASGVAWIRPRLLGISAWTSGRRITAWTVVRASFPKPVALRMVV